MYKNQRKKQTIETDQWVLQSLALSLTGYVMTVPRTLEYIKQVLMNIKGEIDSNMVIEGDFNIPLTSMDRPSRQKVNKETIALNDTLDQMDLIEIFRAYNEEQTQNKSH